MWGNALAAVHLVPSQQKHIINARKMTFLRCMYRASSYNMYINQQHVQNSCD